MPKWPWRRNNTALAKKALSPLPPDAEKALSEDIAAVAFHAITNAKIQDNFVEVGRMDMANPEFHLNKTMEIIDTLDREEIALREQLLNEEIRYKAEVEDGQKHHNIEVERINKQLANTQRTKAGYLACAHVLKPTDERYLQQVGRGNRRVLPDGVVVTDLADGFNAPKLVDEVREAIANNGNSIAEQSRKTFVIPLGYEAVKDAEGRATGEVQPIKPAAPRRRRKSAARVDNGTTGAVDMG